MLEKAPVRPPFPISEYNASNKRTWAPDGCWDYYGGGGSGTISSVLGQMTLFPFYIRYDVPAGALEMKAYYMANGYGTSGNSNTAVWGMYRVGSSLYDSSLYESVTIVDSTSTYMTGAKTQTMSLAYPKGWYIASIVFIAATAGSGSVSSAFAKNEPVFGSLNNSAISSASMGHVGVTGQTSGLPANLNSVTLANIYYHSPVALRY
jgi:hypothetical protein